MIKLIFLSIPTLAIVGCRSEAPQKAMKLDSFTNTLGIKMVKIPEGSFLMGNQEFRKPVHKVIVSSFWISATEVTNRQYESLVPGHKRPPESNLDQGPVTGVSKNEAESFALLLSQKEKRKYRLATDAEWEYAARGGLEQKDFPWGNEPSEKRANSGANGVTHKATRVGSYPPNLYGLYDMVGNAAEWIQNANIVFPPEVDKEIQRNPNYPVPTNMWCSRGGSFQDWYPFVWWAMQDAPSSNSLDFADVGIRLVADDM